MKRMTLGKHVRGCASKQHLCCQSGCLVFVLRILNILNRPFIIFTLHFLFFCQPFLLKLEWDNSAFLVVNGVANDPRTKNVMLRTNFDLWVVSNIKYWWFKFDSYHSDRHFFVDCILCALFLFYQFA